ncbi:MAG: DoxX family protein [Nitrospirae bacterium GWC2_57_13]|jgi:putative oxidoreductase|nr:MAG: DoxX family protein [Nitrospirae bacterium GWC1_57_7]OGW29778.1 MAG: DoxX family protein [Nitrospirae bacterium GWC2_57_13]OGW46758.1 MAG: DoxX family protein [Nitrospirae bacterium GWD2_57_8]HAR46596.1 DoxX family protein [Nitrospiraceae bacterium]HAS53657.1 DoxX family protein [Nitrospiraceae bacterium]
MKANLLGIRNQPVSVDVVLLFMRVIVGYAFILHGWGKIQSPMSWMGAESPVPGIFQALAALSEFAGGFALILGLLTRLGALGIGFTMTVAVLMHRFVLVDPFVNLTGGRSYEQATSYLLIALLLVIVGAGRYSLDRKIFGVAS